MMDAMQSDTLGKLFIQLQATTRGQGVLLLMSESSRLTAAEAALSNDDAAVKLLLLQVMTIFHVLEATALQCCGSTPAVTFRHFAAVRAVVYLTDSDGALAADR